MYLTRGSTLLRAFVARLPLLLQDAAAPLVAGGSASRGDLHRQEFSAHPQLASHGPPAGHVQPGCLGTLQTHEGGASPSAGLQVHDAPQGPPAGQPQPSSRVTVMLAEAEAEERSVLV